MTTPKAEPVLHIQDDRFTVTEWRFSPGAETGWHVHGHDYVIVPLTDGTLGLEEPGGVTRQAALTQGVPYSRRVGINHNVTNLGKAPLAFLEVEATHDHMMDQRRMVLARFIECWNLRDLDGMMDCLVEDCTLYAPDGSVLQGMTAVRAACEGQVNRGRWTEPTQMVLGDTGLCEGRLAGSPGLTDAWGCEVFQFRQDRIAVRRSYRQPCPD